MDSKFDFGKMDSVIEKAQKDETGKLAGLINDLIFTSKKAVDSGLEMGEVAALVSMGWFLSRDPELQSIVEFLLSKTKTDDGYLN